MRVAVYTDQVYWRAGGQVHTARAFVSFLGEIARSCEELVVLGRFDPNPRPPAEALPSHVRFVALPHYADATDVRALARAWAGSVRGFWRALGAADVVWLLGPYPLSVVFAALACLRRRAVVLGVRHDLPEYVRARRAGRTKLLAAALALDGVWRAMARRLPVVVVGPALARKYGRGRRVLAVFVSLVPRDAVAATPPPRGPSHAVGERRLLAVGRLDAEKNPLLLADVLAGLNAAPGPSPWRLTVCGDGPLRGELAGRLEQLGQAGHAELLGHVPAGEALWRLYRESDAFLHVSLTEGFPQVLLEAFACGLPVVATDVGGIAEGAASAVQLVPPADAQAAVAAVQRITVDEGRRLALVEAGLRLARRHTLESEGTQVAGFLRAQTRA